MSPQSVALSVGLSVVLVVLTFGCGRRADRPAEPIDDGKRGLASEDGKKDEEKKGVVGRHALVVGVASYENKAFNDLKYTEHDAEGLAEALKGFDSVRVLTTARGKEKKADAPTAANVKKAIDDLLAKRKKGDTILIAFAGHGVTLELKDPDGKAEAKTYPYFCAADADLLDPRYSTGESETMVNLDDLFAKLGRCGAGTKLVLMDACRNELKIKAGRRSFDARSVSIPDGVAALYSCGRGQFAYETAKLGKSGHGVFFHFAIEGLKGKAKNDEGVVTWDSLSDYVKRQTARQVPALIGGGAVQSPAAMGSLEGESPVLVDAADGKPKDMDNPRDKDGKAVVVSDKADKAFTNSIKMKLVRIPAGKFKMGSPKEEKARVADEHEHEVTISKPFYLGAYEVTQVQYLRVAMKNPSAYRLGGAYGSSVKGLDTDDFPVETVSYVDAVAFCKQLSARPEEQKAGRTYRLPTEAEWEYACRAGTTTRYHFGDEITPQKAHSGYEKRSSGFLNRPCEVGKYKPNAWGLYDMHGNVYEWCADWYAERYYKDGLDQDQDPQRPNDGKQRIVRGGAYDSYAANQRSAARYHYAPSVARYTVGFRVVCEVKK